MHHCHCQRHQLRQAFALWEAGYHSAPCLTARRPQSRFRYNKLTNVTPDLPTPATLSRNKLNMMEETRRKRVALLKAAIRFCQWKALTTLPQTCWSSVVGGNKHIITSSDLKWHVILSLLIFPGLRSMCFFFLFFFQNFHHMNKMMRNVHTTWLENFPSIHFCIIHCIYMTNSKAISFYWPINAVA